MTPGQWLFIGNNCPGFYTDKYSTLHVINVIISYMSWDIVKIWMVKFGEPSVIHQIH